jgi:propanol-preferring alcohol dehydrogenase
MLLDRPGAPLRLTEMPDPSPAADEVTVQIAACGVCRTDLHVVDGELPNPKLPIVPGTKALAKSMPSGSMPEILKSACASGYHG